MILWQLVPSKYFPTPLICILQPLLPCDSPYTLLPTAPSRCLHISATCKIIFDCPSTWKTRGFHLTMQDIFSLGRSGSKLWLGVPCLYLFVFQTWYVTSFITYPKHKHTLADRREDNTPGLVRLPRATNREVFIKNLQLQLQLVVSWT